MSDLASFGLLAPSRWDRLSSTFKASNAVSQSLFFVFRLFPQTEICFVCPNFPRHRKRSSLGSSRARGVAFAGRCGGEALVSPAMCVRWGACH